MQVKTLFNNIHWHLHCEQNNNDNPEKVRNYFKKIYTEFMETGERVAPEFINDVKSALELRNKVITLSGYIKGLKDLKVD